MINVIEIKGTNFSQFTIKKTTNSLVGLQQINVFVGLNNSGKSRLIRNLFVDENQALWLSNELDWNDYKKEFYNHFDIYFNQAETYARQRTVKLNFIEEIKSTLNKLIQDQTIDFNKIYEVFTIFRTLKKSDITWRPVTNEATITATLNKFKEIPRLLENQLKKITKNTKTKKLYIPILRGLRPVQSISDNQFSNQDSYSKRTNFDYFKNLKYSGKIYTGLSIYEDVMKLLLGDENDRNEIRKFEEFLSEMIFLDKVTLIPKYKEDVLHIKIGSSKQFEIYNLGDGFQTIISILFPIFMRRNQESIIFIEEPEAHLHPEWQIQLIKSFKFFTKHQFFISTHSSTFINDNDTSIYLIKKIKGRSEITFTNLESEKVEIIKDLGYKPSDLFMTNFILWVEGPSDKLLLEYWLKKIAPDLKEGHHYSIMFFGGDNYQQFLLDGDEFGLSFIRNINHNFGIILDSDRTKKHQRFSEKKKKVESLFKENNSYCWLTKFREIENYIPYETFHKAVCIVHKKTTIEIPRGEYEDRNTVIDTKSNNSYKSSIKIPQDIFQQIQINKDGTTKNISCKDLRTSIESAIQKTKKQSFKVNKVKVAKKIVSLKPELVENELLSQIKTLVLKIKNSNNMD